MLVSNIILILLILVQISDNTLAPKPQEKGDKKDAKVKFSLSAKARICEQTKDSTDICLGVYIGENLVLASLACKQKTKDAKRFVNVGGRDDECKDGQNRKIINSQQIDLNGSEMEKIKVDAPFDLEKLGGKLIIGESVKREINTCSIFCTRRTIGGRGKTKGSNANDCGKKPERVELEQCIDDKNKKSNKTCVKLYGKKRILEPQEGSPIVCDGQIVGFVARRNSKQAEMVHLHFNVTTEMKKYDQKKGKS